MGMGTNGAGGGPPKGSAWDSPHAETVVTGDPALAPYAPTSIGKDPAAFPSPSDPLKDGDTRERTKLVLRQIPVIDSFDEWTIGQIRSALRDHKTGRFDQSAMLWDEILGDDRVQATLGSRTSGLFGQPTRFKAANKSDAAKECLAAWKLAWPKLATSAAMVQMHETGIGMGFAPAQLLWDTSGPIWNPRLEPWHAKFSYWNWALNRFMAISQDGVIPITPGDAKWVLHAPWGAGPNARPWIRGGVRSTAEPWRFRHWAIRDLARTSEVEGMAIRKAKVPASADQVARDAFAAQLANLGQETTIMVQTGADGMGQDFDLELLEAQSSSWETMIALRDHCDMAIVLALLFQNLTTEVTGGSFAATRAHMDIRSSGIMADNAAWRLTIYEQIARPFAWLNFGDADLAPWTDWQVKPLADWDAMAGMLSKFGTAVEVLRRGGVQFKAPEDVVKLAKSMGIDLPPVMFAAPVGSGAGASAPAPSEGSAATTAPSTKGAKTSARSNVRQLATARRALQECAATRGPVARIARAALRSMGQAA